MIVFGGLGRMIVFRRLKRMIVFGGLGRMIILHLEGYFTRSLIRNYSLPIHMSECHTFSVFKSQLKTVLFKSFTIVYQCICAQSFDYKSSDEHTYLSVN